MKAFAALLILFSALYLADYALTLAATTREGFQELNPLANYWNTGDHATPLYLKLAGLALILPLTAALHRVNAPLAKRTMLNATLLLLAVNSASLAQLTA